MGTSPFLSRYRRPVDDKGRVILPAKWRLQLEGGAYVAEWVDGCLALFPEERFEEVMEEVRTIAKRGDNERRARRAFFSGASDVQPDKQGRISLPAEARDYAGIDREVVLTGQGSYIEIWNPERFEGEEVQGRSVLHSADGIADFVV